MEATLDVTEQSQVAQARRMVIDYASRYGLSEADTGRAALVATEAGTNLVKYGKDGVITVDGFCKGPAQGIDIIVTDRGPGFADFAVAARDGYSTGASLGIGLGVITRASDFFDVYSVVPQGTAFLSRIARGGLLPVEDGLRVAGRSTPKRGQVECGDAWGFERAGRWQRLCVADGLGHGPLAASAATQAVDIFRAAPESDTPADILRRAHAGLRSTRGVVMGVIAIDTQAHEAVFSGVGNISGAVHSGARPHHLLSVDGVVGYNMRAARDQAMPWAAGAGVLMASDGLSSRASLSRYPGLLERHPALVAAVMYRDFARDSDDATVAVAIDA
ncbi:SpoIIE family protein phosphatase [Caenimonas koreensis DSM 17982]|uniref:SpoIIE family protein phosphatase n=1 Tax=Caenimonas koreensis DSM 17982 TaxID=1121255 RepID=A0A844BCD4_9BURK|nr:ATP-binding protein [Caenimonas koreensis]MRD49107.1 SpoIIE family protein phosphatase [Caenimonas koreensis DSM 17982]